MLSQHFLRLKEPFIDVLRLFYSSISDRFEKIYLRVVSSISLVKKMVIVYFHIIVGNLVILNLWDDPLLWDLTCEENQFLDPGHLWDVRSLVIG
jgi:hypothetical protein